jgi:Gp157 protein
MNTLLSPFDLDQRLIDLAERREEALRTLEEIQRRVFVADENTINRLQAELPAELTSIDAEIASYAALSRQGERAVRMAQVDKLRAWLLHIKTMTQLAYDEAKRQHQRAQTFKSQGEWIKALLGEFMVANETKKLEGAHGTIRLRGNGGLEPLEIYDASLIPDELCDKTVTLPLSIWRQALSELSNGTLRQVAAVAVESKIEPSAVRIREALAKPCQECLGHPMADCDACSKTGKAIVPGARLATRGEHVEVR